VSIRFLQLFFRRFLNAVHINLNFQQNKAMLISIVLSIDLTIDLTPSRPLKFLKKLFVNTFGGVKKSGRGEKFLPSQ
jgi:hypothetical protein